MWDEKVTYKLIIDLDDLVLPLFASELNELTEAGRTLQLQTM